jgi:hypothetical protein
METPLEYAIRCLRDAHAEAQADNADEALISANAAVEMLLVEVGEREDPRLASESNDPQQNQEHA